MSSSKNLEFEKTAFLSKSNSAFIEEMYMKFVNNDPSLPESWRKYFNETDHILSKKVIAAISNSINVIFCVGEELSERENNEHFDVIKNQLSIGLFELDNDQLKKIVIAYEPVWAIGTGKTANSPQIQEMHHYIRNLIKSNFNDDISNEIRILYGGSVKANNASEIFSLPDVDGGLIGGASLNFSDFNAIVHAANG